MTKSSEAHIHQNLQLIHNHCHIKQAVILCEIQFFIIEALPVIGPGAMILCKQNSRRRVLHRLIVMLRKNHMRTFSTCLTIFIQKIHIDLLPQLTEDLLCTGLEPFFLMDHKLLQPATARKCPGSHLHQGIRKFQPFQFFASIKNISSDFLQCIGKNDLLHFLSGKKPLFSE